MYAEQILDTAAARIRAGLGDTGAEDVIAVFTAVAEAVGFLQGLQRGALIHPGNGAPAAELGEDGDAYVDLLTADLYFRQGGAWVQKLTLRGRDGKDGKNGSNGQNGKDGAAGKSLYQLWLEAGNAGTVAEFLASQQPKDGRDGSDGSDGNDGRDGADLLDGPADPDASQGKDGDLYLNYTTGAVLRKVAGVWIKRGNLMGPQGPKGDDGKDGSNGTGSGAGSGPQLTAQILLGFMQGASLSADGSKVVVAAGITPEKDLNSNSEEKVPSVAAVRAAVAGIVSYHELLVSITQTTTRVPMYWSRKVAYSTHTANYNVATVVYTLSYLDSNGDEIKAGPFTAFGGTSGLNAAIAGLTDGIVSQFGYTVYADYALKAGRSSAEARFVTQAVATA